MLVFDRSAEAEEELRSLDAFENITGALILTAIERRNQLRISITNLGLGDDLSLTIHYISRLRPAEVTTILQFAKREYRVKSLTKDGPGSLPSDCV